jgi:hypothetical protein
MWKGTGEMYDITTFNADKTIDAVNARGIKAEMVFDRATALERLTSLIPAGAQIMTGGSLTLQQIGFEDLLISGQHSWRNLKDALLAEKDPPKQMRLRREAGLAEYFIGSPQAITENGELIFVSAGGSQLPAYTFSAPNVIWIAGVQKIVPDVETALRRVREVALPAEDARMKALGYPGSFVGKTVIFEREPEMMGRNLHLILVNEQVGV